MVEIFEVKSLMEIMVGLLTRRGWCSWTRGFLY